MGRYDGSDLMFTEDGDIVIGENGDFALVHDRQFVEQSSRNRLKVSDPDWFDFDMQEIGANLEDLIGRPNSIETAREGVERISKALTRNDLISREDLYIRPVPLTKYVIQFFVYIQTSQEGDPIGFAVSFNLESGVAIRSV